MYINEGTNKFKKNFTQSKWIQSLVETKWEKLGETENVNAMAECFNM